MLVSTLPFALLLAACVYAESWTWPDQAGADSVRIDHKVRFVDEQPQRNTKRDNRDNVQADEIQEPSDTTGFYNRPPGSGRYPVRVELDNEKSIRINGQDVYLLGGRNRNQGYSDGTLDSLQHCKCVSRPDCKVQRDYKNACGTNQYLCCFNIPNRHNSEYFNEVEDERPMLYPNQGDIAGPFPSPYETDNDGVFGPGHGHDNILLGQVDRRRQPQNILVGPDGPTGNIGPPHKQVLVGPGGPTGVIGPDRPVLVGPQGPTGIIGPANENRDHQNILVGPNGPTGDLGQSEAAQRGVLVGPGGPTGIIGPGNNRPVLVGPGGPTGIIGPRRPVLVGPGGPTGVIGPGYNRPSQRPGILVGPGGPTGIIGPGRRILVGPGGPTGQIGPNYYGK